MPISNFLISPFLGIIFIFLVRKVLVRVPVCEQHLRYLCRGVLSKGQFFLIKQSLKLSIPGRHFDCLVQLIHPVPRLWHSVWGIPAGCSWSALLINCEALLFSCMFCIERKIVHVGTENLPRSISNKFTLIYKVLALLSLMRKITQFQDNGKTFLKLF